ncbi:MAG: hypothetical protein ACT4PP_01110 [Sporichthyaceae bacterium]
MNDISVMTGEQARDLCLKLMRADTKNEVVDILKAVGLWDDIDAWRLFSDTENNYSSIGNQQADAVAALNEKLINAEDARLVNACRLAGVDPESPAAPQTMRAAVARFFEGKQNPTDSDGRIAEWGSSQSTEEGRKLTVAATGNMPSKGQPSLTVADQGEGQTPDDFPNTFMSLNRSNKLRIPFVQGKFNMGGTGALRFSEVQLVVSRRNPALLSANHSARDEHWGFTIVRRMPPAAGAKSSVYRYLAPVVIPGEKLRGVLTFAAAEMPIFPEVTKDVRDAYHRKSQYGSLVKLYEYTWQGTKSNIVLADDGLLRRIDVGLPELALPIRVFECRPEYKGHAGSFETNALGLVARLDRDKADKLETDEPIGGILALDDGTQIKLRVYVFKDKATAKQYRNRASGVVFGVNGQMHGTYSTDFFTRAKVGLGYLDDSMLVYADCSQIDGETREDLFMNSRDRLSVNHLSRQLEAKLESFLRGEGTLKDLHLKRRQKRVQEKLAEDKPLNDVLQGLMRNNPILSKLFLLGQSLSSPFPPDGGGGGGGVGEASEFVGKRYPDYFRFRDRKDGEELRRKAHIGVRTRVIFETDAEDAYFLRDHEPGAWNVRRKVDGQWVDAGDWSTTGPKSGIAHLSFEELPPEAKVGDTLEYLIEVTDPVRFDAFTLPLTLDIAPTGPGGGGGGGGGKTKIKNTGKGSGGGGESTFSLPNITPVTAAEFTTHDFDELSVLKIVHASEDPKVLTYDFFINVDNKYLLHSQKARPDNADVLKKQFIYGFVLVGLALLQEHHKQQVEDDAEPVEDHVLRTTRALGPILIPMLQAIGTLNEE